MVFAQTCVNTTALKTFDPMDLSLFNIFAIISLPKSLKKLLENDVHNIIYTNPGNRLDSLPASW